jgi:nicotinamidase-related amidase
MSKKSALLIIDVQVNVVKDAYNRDQVLDNIHTLLGRARGSDTPVMYVQHEGREGDGLAAGTPGWQIHPAISPRQGEPVVHKRACDAFHQTSLQQELEQRGIDHLVVVGALTDYCVATSVRRATTCGYDVTLVSDAHTTEDNEILIAEQVIAYHNALLNGFRTENSTITVKPTSQITFSSQ